MINHPKIKRLYSSGMGFSLSWNIFYETLREDYTLENFERLMHSEDDSANFRRYAEVLLERKNTHQDIMRIVNSALTSNRLTYKRAKILYSDFSDWDCSNPFSNGHKFISLEGK